MKKKNPPIMALKAFEVVARHNSFKIAASELSITPGALSQHVKNLEDYFGFSLFNRRKPSLEISARGMLLSKGLTEAFSKIRNTLDEMSELEESSRLIISAETSLASKWLATEIPHFSSHHPGINTAVTSSHCFDENNHKLVDVGICISNDIPSHLYQEKIGSESLVVVGSSALIQRYNINEPKDVAKVPLLTETSLSVGEYSWMSWFNLTELQPSAIDMGINFGPQADQAIEAAVNGGGLLLTRSTLVKNDLASGRLRIPFGPVLNIPLSYTLICQPNKLHVPNVKSFMQWVRTAFRLMQMERDYLTTGIK